MKKVIMSVAVLVCHVMMFGAQAQCVSVNESKEPFSVAFDKLCAYLELTPTQMDEVYNINAYFIDQQQQSMRIEVSQQKEQMRKAVYGNLKLMKKELTAEQYRKYVTLLNVTNNNRRLSSMPLTDVYLAENENKEE